MTPTGEKPAAERPPTRSQRPRRRLARILPLGALALLTSGCGVPIFGFPTVHATVQSNTTLELWKYSCVAALAVGAFVAALIIYAPLRFRKRDDELPRQVRYNLPVEVLYTVVPFIIIAALFYYTAKDENYIDHLDTPAQFQAADGVTVDVVGYQWNWKFEYPQSKYAVAISGNQDNMPTLYLPMNRPVRFIETSKDVIHSFWIVDFLFKRDVIPGRVNQFELTPDRAGTYVGRCAELCGVYHDRMNFQVVVLPSNQFDARMAQLNAAVQKPNDPTATSIGATKLDSDAGTTAVGDQGGSNSNQPNAVTNSDPTAQRSHTIGSSP